MALITAAEMLEALRQAVALKGENYVYEYPTYEGGEPTAECVYIDPSTGGPSCVVAYALDVLRPDIWKASPVVQGNRTANEFTDYRENVLEVTVEAATVARAAQRVQDNEKPWSEALRAAEETYADFLHRHALEGV